MHKIIPYNKLNTDQDLSLEKKKNKIDNIKTLPANLLATLTQIYADQTKSYRITI
jgi:hypothetical protein